MNPHPFTLDYDIYYAKDRNEYVKQIVATCETELTTSELELLGNYIIFGKDETHLSLVDTKEALPPPRKYNSYATKDEKNISLDSILEDPVQSRELEEKMAQRERQPRYRNIVQKPQRPTYDENGVEIDAGWAADNYGNPIPYIRELWQSIDKWKRRIDMWKGKIPPDEWALAHQPSSTLLYKINHFFIDLQRQQYYIKDVYNPEIHFQCFTPSAGSDCDFDAPSGYWLTPEEWCARKRNPRPFDLPQPPIQEAPTNSNGQIFWKTGDNVINFEDYHHVGALLDHYAALWRRNYDRLDSNARFLCMDLERYVEMANLDELEQYVLEARVAHRNRNIILRYLNEDGYDISEGRLRTLSRVLIPKKIAAVATRERLLSEMTRDEIPSQICKYCHKPLPRHPFFYNRDQSLKSGFGSACKLCQKERRKSKDGNKQNLPKVQDKQTNK